MVAAFAFGGSETLTRLGRAFAGAKPGQTEKGRGCCGRILGDATGLGRHGTR